MSDNVLQTTQKFIQDVLAPDVRETKVRVGELDKRLTSQVGELDRRLSERIDMLEKRMDERFESMEKRIDANTQTILAEIRALKTENELVTMRAIADVRERLAVLEFKQSKSEAA